MYASRKCLDAAAGRCLLRMSVVSASRPEITSWGVDEREDGLDRRTDDPDSSGAASPTAMTSQHDGDDLIADNGQDNRPVGIFAASPVLPRTPDDSMYAPSAWDADAIGSIADQNGTGGAGSALTDLTAAGDASVPPAGAVGTSAFDSPAFGASAFDSSAFSFSPQVSAQDSPGPDSWSTGSASWSLSDASGPSADGSPATDAPPLVEPGTSLPFGSSSFGAAYAAEPPRVSPPPAPSTPDPPPAVSAAAFRWDTPDPPPTSPSSPARTFLRSTGSTKSPPPARPPVTVSAPPQTPPVSPAPQAPPVRSPAPARKAPPKAAPRRSVRQAHLTIARIDPWSVMKFSFVVSLVAFIILFIVVAVLWGTLSTLGVFDSLQRVVSNVTSSQGSAGVNAEKWFSASRVLGWTALLGSLNIVLITAMSTIGAVVYNLTSRLVGGVEVTLRETE